MSLPIHPIAPPPLEAKKLEYLGYQIIAEKHLGLRGQTAWVAIGRAVTPRPLLVSVLCNPAGESGAFTITSERHTEGDGELAAILEVQQAIDWLVANEKVADLLRIIEEGGELEAANRWLLLMRRALNLWRDGGISDEAYAHLIEVDVSQLRDEHL